MNRLFPINLYIISALCLSGCDNSSVNQSFPDDTVEIFASEHGLGVAVPEEPDTSATLRLENLDLANMTQGYDRPTTGKSLSGTLISIGGQTFSKGIGTHANSELLVDLAENAKSFSAYVGVDDGSSNGTVYFEVWVDGTLATKTDLLRTGDRPVKISVDLTGAKQMRLVVDGGEDGTGYDHSDWADAKLELLDPDTTLPVSVPIIKEQAVDHGPQEQVVNQGATPP